MAVDNSYQGANYGEQGGDTLVVGGTLKVEAAGEIHVAAGGTITDDGTQAAAISDFTITYTSNDPAITPDGALTIADGSTPTVDELLHAVEELQSQVNSILAALRGVGIIATS